MLPSLLALHRQLGDIFQISFPGFHPVVMAGPEACRFVLVDARDDLAWRPGDDPVARLLRRGLLVVDGEEHHSLRRGMSPAFQRHKVLKTVVRMVEHTDKIARTWDLEHPIEGLAEMRKIALLILMDALFAVDITPDLDRLWKPILDLLSYISPGLWLIWRGGPRANYSRSIRVMDEYLYGLVKSRRNSITPGDDLLSYWVKETDLTDDLIRDQLLTLLIAGHDTSTALLAWSLYLLGSHPEVLARARVEVDEVTHGEPPGAEHLPRLIYLGQVIDETLRLYPPIHTGNRVARKDLEFGGYCIPAGARLIYSIYATHHDERNWPDPERFDPGRFNPGVKIQPYSYLPFGGGPRNCIGAGFAGIEARVILARLIQTFDIRLVGGRARQHMGATLEPKPGVRLRMTKREQ
jgi:cytochrome P450